MRTYTAFVLFLITTTCSALQRQSLNGQWSVEGAGSGITIPDAVVPGGIFSDLMNHGNIGDVFYGTGDVDNRWVGETDWTYSREFTVDAGLYRYRIVYIVFEGLDTFATITVNGNEVATTENMFRRYAFNIKRFLQVGSNTISITFTSAVYKAAVSANDSSIGYPIPPDCPANEYNGICYANRIRKMQASFSWDWGPAFASAGIWKDVYLEAFDTAIIEYVVAIPVRDPDTNEWSLSVTTYIDSGESFPIYGTLSAKLEIANKTHTVSTFVDENSHKSYETIINMSVSTSSDEIELWWPNGYGDQVLYDLTMTFFGDDDEEDRKTVRVGFRTIELVQDELDRGLTFYFKVNGQPIFAKGANEIPINVLPEKGQNEDTIRHLLQSAKDVHMNMLRVWGGGVYESDYFYDLADEYGILIWQDFMFACALYPATDEFLENVAEEVRDQIRRLASHPSIAIWSGNNENEAALSQNWYGTTDYFDSYKADYIKLYVDVIQTEISEIVPNAIYVTSSPTNGLETNQEDHLAANPQDVYYGDVHFYDYFSDSWHIPTFPTPRFSSEFGYQSMPSVDSWMTVTDNLNDLLPDSSFLYGRQHHPDGNSQNLDLINQQLQMPDSSNENYASAFVYYSQILQAQSIKTEVEHYRSFKGRVNSDGQGYTMGALYWQLNDVWVAPTWAGIEFTGRWKMLHYQARNFYSPMIVTGQITDDDELEIYAVIDGLELPDISARAVLHVVRWDQLQPLVSIEFPVDLDLSQSVLVTSVNAPTVLTTAGCGNDYAEAKTNCFFHLHLMDQDNNEVAPANYVFPEKLKNSALSNANVQISGITSADDEGKEFDIVVSTDTVALFVWLDSHDIKGTFSDNGFLDIQDSTTVRFTADEPVSVDDLTAALTVTHLRDSNYL